MTLVRVYCGLASADGSALAPEAPSWLTVSIVDDSGRLLDICEITDDPGGYSELCSLFAQRVEGPASVAVATASNNHVVTQLLTAAGRYIAYAGAESADDFAERFADDGSPDEIRSGPAERRAIGLARALQAGVLSAVPQATPQEMFSLKPLLIAHAAIVTGRQQAAGTLREVLRELYPAALRAYADPAEPVSLAVLQALPEPGQMVTGSAGRSREGQVIAALVDAGVAEKEILDEAVTALRVAIAETPRRAGVTRAMTSAVAETVRQAVASVRCFDSASEALVGVIADRMTPPVRLEEQQPSHEPVGAYEAANSRGATPLRVVSGGSGSFGAPAAANGAGPAARPEEPAASLPPAGMVAIPAARPAEPAAYGEQHGQSTTELPSRIASGRPSMPTAIPPSTRQSRPAYGSDPAATFAGQPAFGSDPSTTTFAGQSAFGSDPATTTSAGQPTFGSDPATTFAGQPAAPAELGPEWHQPGSGRASVPFNPAAQSGFAPQGSGFGAPDRFETTQTFDAPLSFETTHSFGQARSNGFGQAAVPGAAEPPQNQPQPPQNQPPAPRPSPEVQAPGTRSSWPNVGDPADRSASGMFPVVSGPLVSGTGAADVPLPSRGADRPLPMRGADVPLPIRNPEQRAAEPVGPELPRQREGRVKPPWQSDDLPVEPPTLRLVEPAPLADPALSGSRSSFAQPSGEDPDVDRFDPPTLRLVPPAPLPAMAPPAPMAPSEPISRHGLSASSANLADLPPVEGGADDSDLLIFSECRSAWFTDPDETDEQLDWVTAADLGWEAASQAARPAVGAETSAGLPRRVPQQNLVPGSAQPEPEETEQPPLRIVRDAAAIAAHTSGYFSGYRRGQEVGGYSVGGRPGRESAGGWDFTRDGSGDEEYTPLSDYEYRSSAHR